MPISELAKSNAQKLQARGVKAASVLMTCLLLWMLIPLQALAQISTAPVAAQDVMLQTHFWIDEGGKTPIEQVAQAAPATFQPFVEYRSFFLNKDTALWIRWTPPSTRTQEVWYLQLSSSAFFDRASLFQRNAAGQWTEQRAGDHLAVSQWNHPDQTPVFKLEPDAAGPVWLRLENSPASIAPRLKLLNEQQLTSQRRWSYMLLGGYFGFTLLVLFLGFMHVYLYRDRAFVAYSTYVSCMLIFQLAFTGMGGLFLWPQSPWWNNAAPGIFMLLLSATGNWFVREASMLQRHSKRLDYAFMTFAAIGLVMAMLYTAWSSRTMFVLLNLYGLLTVILGIAVCMWVWRRGERYGLLIFLGFLPLYLGYPFPALRSAGVIADSWHSQYAVLIGSALEIPLLLYVLHMRAKEFSENSARMRAVDHTDPLTGLAMEPVLTLRVRDAMRSAISQTKNRVLMLVELANHAEIVQAEGRTVGDRALVVTASCLVSTTHELDTVCRIDTTRFAVLVHAPLGAVDTTTLAQRILARGLSQHVNSRPDVPMRFRVVTSTLQQGSISPKPSQPIDLQAVLAPLVHAMNKLALEHKKSIVHLSAWGQSNHNSGSSLP